MQTVTQRVKRIGSHRVGGFAKFRLEQSPVVTSQSRPHVTL
jgi:hypothetical protein